MNLQSVQRNWDKLGELDPMWAVLSDPAKLGGHWDRQEFYATGEREISEVMEQVARLFAQLPRRRALDFGCGLGRLSRALSSRFTSVTGVDIAPSMIRQASQLNADLPNCEFILNESDDLRRFADGSFDLVYTNIVLQHMPPQYARSYLREFARITASGGAIVFQMPDKHPISFSKRLKAMLVPVLPFIPRFLLSGYLKRHYPGAPEEFLQTLPEHPMELHGVRKREILSLMEQIGAPVVYCDEEIGEGWRSYRYFAARR